MKKIIFLILLASVAYGDTTRVKQEVKKVKRQIKTNYDINGRPVNQSMDAKGFHRVYGSVTFDGDSSEVVTLNDSPVDGKQDISFIDSTSYSGRAWAYNGEDWRYWIIPVSGLQFEIRSDNDTSTATVRFVVEGE